jgi:hypothetical protein
MPTTNTDINERVREIAAIQRQLADLLNAAGAKVRELEIAMSDKANELEDAITRRSKPISAAEVAEAFAEYRVNTGELNSRLIDAIERRGHAVFPPKYEPIRAAWALVENRW